MWGGVGGTGGGGGSSAGAGGGDDDDDDDDLYTIFARSILRQTSESCRFVNEPNMLVKVKEVSVES